MTPKLKNLAFFEKDKSLGVFAEVQDINENILALTEAVKAIPQPVVQEMPEMPEPVEAVPITNFPETQKVQVTNFPTMPEHKAPIVNVPAPIVNVNAPIVKVDNKAVADEIKKITDILSKEENASEIEKVNIIDSEGKIVDFKTLFSNLSTNIGNIKVSGGGSSAVFIKSPATQNPISVATSENQATANTSLALIKAKTDNLDVLLSSRTSQTVNQPTTLEDINISLKNLLNAFVRPIWVEPTVGATTPRLNINTCSVVTTLSIVSGYAMPTSFASASSTQAGITQTQVYSTDRINWQQNIRSRIT